MNNEIKERADKILEEIRSMNLSKEVLCSLNFGDLILQVYAKLYNTGEEGNYFYLILQEVIKSYTNLPYKEFGYLYYSDVNTKEDFIKAINYKDEFNFQLSQYFNNSII